MSFDPLIGFFALGVLARLVRSDLKLPGALYETLSVVLLLAIGIKGGLELARQPIADLILPVLLVVLLGVVITLLAFTLLRWRFDRANAAAIAAHYGSVSVVTFAVASSYLMARGIAFEAHAPLFLVVLELPALIVGILLARGLRSGSWGSVMHEALAGKTVVLLGGGLLIGALAGPNGLPPLDRLYLDLFKPVLSLFLLEMGLVIGERLPSLKQAGAFLLGFAVLAPPLFASLGLALAYLMGLSPGGAVLLATLAASASYIAAPATMRMAVPEANPAWSIAAALGLTFPFNLLVGIPLYHQMSHFVYGG
jgi:uncharacterized protein